MILLQYYNGKEWVLVGKYITENMAWISLGGDDIDYRTVTEDGSVITDKSYKKRKCREKRI